MAVDLTPQLQLSLRPRTAWEAMDWGVRLVNTQAGLLGRAYGPVALGVCVLAVGVALLWTPWAAAGLVWWLKPWLDRGLLRLLSRAVVGWPEDRAELWSAAGWGGAAMLRRMLLPWERLSTCRAYIAPVTQLEGLSGQPARQRIKRLLSGRRTLAVRNQSVWAHIELQGVLALLSFGYWFTPFLGVEAPTRGGFDETLDAIMPLLYVLMALLVEPFHVATGLLLYVHRRAELESWDVELALRGAFPEASA